MPVRSLPENPARRRIHLLLAAPVALLLPALVSTSVAQTASDAPAPSAAGAAAPKSTPKSTTVWLNPGAAPLSVAIVRTPPDPAPLVEKDQWIYDLRYGSGDLYLLGIHHVELATPRSTPRVMGRFALELYEGATLMERARFDFPMLGDVVVPPLPSALAGAAAKDGGSGKETPLHGRAPNFANKLITRVGVMFPAAKRGTKLFIVDRATETRWPLPWPPVEMASTAPPGGEASDAPSGG